MFCIVQRNPIPTVSASTFGIGSNQLLAYLSQALGHNIHAFRVKREKQSAQTSKKIDSTSTLSDDKNQGKDQIEGTDQECPISEEKKVEENNKEVQKIVVQKIVENTRGRQAEQHFINPRRLIRRTQSLAKKDTQQQKNESVLSNSTLDYVDFLAIIPKLRKMESKEISKKAERLFDRQVEEWIFTDETLPTKRQRFYKKFQ